jgi:glutaredoxin
MLKIYTKNLCPYCDMAKAYLKRHDIPFEEMNIEEDSEAREFLLLRGHRTVPQIYHSGALFVEGGADALTKLSAQEIRERMGELGLDGLSL